MLANSSEGANQTLDDEDKVQTEHDYSQWPVKKKKLHLIMLLLRPRLFVENATAFPKVSSTGLCLL